MIKYAEGLYLTEKTDRDIKKIKRKLRYGVGMAEMYVIMMSESKDDVFDIVHAAMFKSRRYRHLDHNIIGLAESRRKAYKLVERMVTEHYERCGKYEGLKADYMHRF